MRGEACEVATKLVVGRSVGFGFLLIPFLPLFPSSAVTLLLVLLLSVFVGVVLLLQALCE